LGVLAKISKISSPIKMQICKMGIIEISLKYENGENIGCSVDSQKAK
jgi:hypothetical protein